LENLWRHSDWRSAISFEHELTLIDFFSKAEICQLYHKTGVLFLKQNICQLYISVDNTFEMDLFDSIPDTKYNLLDYLFWYLRSIVFFQVLFKIAFFAKLKHKVIIIGSLQAVVKLYDLRM
jgi:hypothetical protein